MATLKKYNVAGQEIGQVQVDESLVHAEANGQMIKDYIVALRANARQWSANTKTRSEVNHSTKKPHPQKGQGRARQGMLSAPQYKGGGRVFGPKPKFDQHVRINKKEKRAAIRFLLGEKIRENKIHLIENYEMDAPKTKTVANFITTRTLPKRVLFLGEGSYLDFNADGYAVRINMPSTKHVNFIKSLRNIPKMNFALATNINGYDVLCAHEIVMTEAALQEIQQWLC
ncbi:MAG: 50S ribosomal protein L4 [Parachlamydiaceae bacterium]|nr:50S ribosomal protein L4 [Parachlamydiaceae bacterium]